MRARRFVLSVLFLLLFLGAGTAGAGSDERRVALIIGNDGYKSLPRLNNAANDARAMDHTLTGLGFETITRIDVDRREMNRALNEFAGRLSGGGIGLFFYAGHGIQSSDRNFLVPVDALLESEQDLEAEAMDAGRVMRTMEESRGRVNIVIFDACRDNPLPKKGRSAARGLAVVAAPGGSFIAYAAGPGQAAQDGDAGGNGVYTGALVEALKIPNLKIEDVFKRVAESVRGKTGGKQVPWIQASMQGDFFFNTAVSGAVPGEAASEQPPPARAAPAPAAGVDPTTIELRFWESSEKANSQAAYEAYVKRYPNGSFIDLAKAKLGEFKASQAKAKSQQQVAAVKVAPPSTTAVPKYRKIIEKIKGRWKTTSGNIMEVIDDGDNRFSFRYVEAVQGRSGQVFGEYRVEDGIITGYGITYDTKGRCADRKDVGTLTVSEDGNTISRASTASNCQVPEDGGRPFWTTPKPKTYTYTRLDR